MWIVFALNRQSPFSTCQTCIVDPIECSAHRLFAGAIAHTKSTSSGVLARCRCCCSALFVVPQMTVRAAFRREPGWKGHSSRHHRMWLLTNAGARMKCTEKRRRKRWLLWLSNCSPFGISFFSIFFFLFRFPRVLAPRYIYLLIFFSSLLFFRFVLFRRLFVRATKVFRALWISLLLCSFVLSRRFPPNRNFWLFFFPQILFGARERKSRPLHVNKCIVLN